MELLDLHMLAFLVFFGFMASFIDSVVGGGGLISIPALMWTGLPPVTVLGTNKCAAVMGAFTSFATFVRSGKVDVWLIKRLFPIALIGSGLGVLTVRLIPPDVLRPLVVVMLIAVLIYSVLKKDWGRENHYAGMWGHAGVVRTGGICIRLLRWLFWTRDRFVPVVRVFDGRV